MSLSEASRRGRANNRKGKAFELAVERLMRASGLHATRPRQTGTDDQGDLHITAVRDGDMHVMVAECKNSNTLKVPAWWREAESEVQNFSRFNPSLGTSPALIMKREGVGPQGSLVVLRLDDFISLLKGNRNGK